MKNLKVLCPVPSAFKKMLPEIDKREEEKMLGNPILRNFKNNAHNIPALTVREAINNQIVHLQSASQSAKLFHTYDFISASQ